MSWSPIFFLLLFIPSIILLPFVCFFLLFFFFCYILWLWLCCFAYSLDLFRCVYTSWSKRKQGKKTTIVYVCIRENDKGGNCDTRNRYGEENPFFGVTWSEIFSGGMWTRFWEIIQISNFSACLRSFLNSQLLSLFSNSYVLHFFAHFLFELQ